MGFIILSVDICRNSFVIFIWFGLFRIREDKVGLLENFLECRHYIILPMLQLKSLLIMEGDCCWVIHLFEWLLDVYL